MGRKVDLDNVIAHIKLHGEYVTGHKKTDSDLDRCMNEVYALAHKHIIDLLNVLAYEGKI